MKAKDTIYPGTAKGAFVSGFFFLVTREPIIHGFQLLAVSWSALVTTVEDPPVGDTVEA